MHKTMQLPAGKWILAKEIRSMDDLWYKVLILTDMEVEVLEEHGDGWVICQSIHTQLKYKIWTHDLLERS
jgi:hypothetical protein